MQLMKNTVTILDLKSGIPQLVINAGVKVHGLRVAKNNVVVVVRPKVQSAEGLRIALARDVIVSTRQTPEPTGASTREGI